VTLESSVCGVLQVAHVREDAFTASDEQVLHVCCMCVAFAASDEQVLSLV